MTMETRTLGRTGLEVGVIGLGVEHLAITRENMNEVFDLAVSAGLNYVDLVYNDPLDEHAAHWAAIAPALRQHRTRLLLAVHWGFVEHEPIDHCAQCFFRVLQMLGNAYADIAMLTMVDSEEVWAGWAQQSIERLRSYQRRNRVGFIGMSSHDPGVARVAVESGLIDVLMFPVNLYQHQDGPERQALLESCAAKQVGVVAMKPYYGGRLLTASGRPSGITPAQCLHYVLSQQVATAVPGVQDADELGQALEYLQASAVERGITADQEELEVLLEGQCVSCKHCLPCPEDIAIPEVIECLDYFEYFGHGPGHEDSSREWYAALTAKGSDCVECGTCVERCPFGVDIIGKMRRAAEVFETAPA
jgi:predicted aldo/keto reductase-like oxidoreductase